MASIQATPVEKQEDHLKKATTDDLESSSVDIPENGTSVIDDPEGELKKKKIDLYLLHFLSLMYFFNAVDRSNLGNAKTDGLEEDLNFKGNEYSLLILLVLLSLHPFSARWALPSLVVFWGGIATLQIASTNFAGILVLRLLLRAAEAGFFAGVVFYFTLFYRRSELGFRVAIFFGSALLAAGFSGSISYGASARARTLRDGFNKVGTKFGMKDCFATWKDWKFALWCVINFTYPVAFATTSNFLPQITVAPNAVGFVVLLVVTKSSDHFHERMFHVFRALATSLVGMILLITIDVLNRKGLAYFACFLMTARAYIPSCLVQSWHNNNLLDENSRAATTGLLVGLGNFVGIMSVATFCAEYAPQYIPTLVLTCCSNVIAMARILTLGGWMKLENRRRNRAQGVNLRAQDVDISDLTEGGKSPKFRFFTWNWEGLSRLELHTKAMQTW
ncbi:hypothetical protein ACJZ2D_003833 [Fusarium nematophilum]